MKYLAQLKIAPKLLLIESEDSQGFVSAYIYKESFQGKTLPPLYQEKLKRLPPLFIHHGGLFLWKDSSFGLGWSFAWSEVKGMSSNQISLCPYMERKE